MISRSNVVQGLLNLYERPHYLEVGVNRGVTFHAARAFKKVAVDPKFIFDEPPDPRGCDYHEVTSDVYFGSIARPDDLFQVIYLDGLHTFEQTLRDLINAVSHLAPNGCILIDDVIPNSYQAALPNPMAARAVREFVKQTDPSWMGDVYKLVFFVQSFFQKFSYATIEDNHGQLVMWQQARRQVVPRGIEDFSHLSFVDVVMKRDNFLVRKFEDILLDVAKVASPKAATE